MKDFDEWCKMLGIRVSGEDAQLILFQALYDLIIDTRRTLEKN